MDVADLVEEAALSAGHGRELPRRTARHDPVYSSVDAAIDQRAQDRGLDLPRCVERSCESGKHTAKRAGHDGLLSEVESVDDLRAVCRSVPSRLWISCAADKPEEIAVSV